MRYTDDNDDIEIETDESNEKTVTRRQILRFYLWAVRQERQNYRTLGCAAMFGYLTGFRAAEVRPFKKIGLAAHAVWVMAAKRKKRKKPVVKEREWSTRLRCVVARALDRKDVERSEYLFAPTKRSTCYTRSGWGSSWQDAMHAWITTFDPTSKLEDTAQHPAYFTLHDVRPAAITKKLEVRAADAYDFAAHANPQTTHRHYDRRIVRRASATE